MTTFIIITIIKEIFKIFIRENYPKKEIYIIFKKIINP